MAKLPETPQWEEEVYQIETSDPVLGGPNGISNRQAKQLANRTTWLKQQQESISKDLGNYLSKTVTADQTVASTVIFKSNVYSYGEVMIQAATGKPNALFRFRDETGADKGAIYAQTDIGQLNFRWNGSAYTAQFKSDGSVVFPAAVFSGSVALLKTGDYGIGQVGMSLTSKTTGFIAQAAQSGLAPGNGAGFQSAYASNRRAQLYISTDGTVTSRFTLADTPDTDTTPWNKHYTTANAVADANGFLKSASAPTDAALIRSDFPVGIPQPWPTNTAPAGWLKCNGAAFDKAKYPLLAVAYPSGVLPDLRGEFIRGADDGRGVDSGRTLLSAQMDAVQKFTGKTNGLQHFIPGLTPQGIISQGETVATTTGLTETTGGTGNGVFRVNIDASLQIRTATETRPRNIAFNYIVRAA
ncbi:MULTISPECIES: phage tail protein [unclassified Serratia (in: enterobacteria)]|uniref:phage tail protein n=1 Tax=unclassified Serratia (in: enterobacteria) TaxID=2647522 RepID=UPI000A57B111|nr:MULTISPECIES: phage tail protein [unclassified Serratia (in: enterobacteria)]